MRAAPRFGDCCGPRAPTTTEAGRFNGRPTRGWPEDPPDTHAFASPIAAAGRFMVQVCNDAKRTSRVIPSSENGDWYWYGAQSGNSVLDEISMTEQQMPPIHPTRSKRLNLVRVCICVVHVCKCVSVCVRVCPHWGCHVLVTRLCDSALHKRR